MGELYLGEFVPVAHNPNLYLPFHDPNNLSIVITDDDLQSILIKYKNTPNYPRIKKIKLKRQEIILQILSQILEKKLDNLRGVITDYLLIKEFEIAISKNGNGNYYIYLI